MRYESSIIHEIHELTNKIKFAFRKMNWIHGTLWVFLPFEPAALLPAAQPLFNRTAAAAGPAAPHSRATGL